MLAATVSAIGPPLFGSPSILPIQAFDPSMVTEASPAVRAAASFLLTILFGGAVIYRGGGRLDGAVEASSERPLAAVVYGLMAFGIVTFFVVYAFSQLANLGIGTTVLTALGAVVFAVAFLSLGGLGFAVVGVWVTESFGGRDPWAGLVGVGAVSAVAWLVLPAVVSVAVWLAIAAIGLGGPARRWVHGSGPPADPA
ncbi:hypothetical protein EGH21_15615 [Halomicroarcula sp. F13]|uniref:Uncharacterized protein n=1 Tax=Haloarcula rubra TaxID=2487747 RepID=A0AAW4PW42_9EURY|nr:hypothetical protein [Halomicroarcula rubra]MBX0324457.1 hypothetical protein [Halomicroarcula rubra]